MFIDVVKEVLTSIIVDDESAARNELEAMLIDHCPEVKVLEKVASAQAARVSIELHKPDILFLDVRMPKESGFELLDSIELNDMAVVFVTAYDKYAVKAFKTCALHYLIKPCLPEEVCLAVSRAKHALSEQKILQKNVSEEEEPDHAESLSAEAISKMNPVLNSRLMVGHKSGFNLLKTNDLLYLESSGNYTIFHIASGSNLLASRHLGFFEAQLPAHQFLRIHRSYLINLDRIEGYESGAASFVLMEGSNRLEISRRKLKELMTRLTGNA